MKNIFFILGLFFLISVTFSQLESDTETDFSIPPPPENDPEDLVEDFDDSDVLVLNESNFNETIKQNHYIMVEFYARTFLNNQLIYQLYISIYLYIHMNINFFIS